jgi:hypothetical protein
MMRARTAALMQIVRLRALQCEAAEAASARAGAAARTKDALLAERSQARDAAADRWHALLSQGAFAPETLRWRSADVLQCEQAAVEAATEREHALRDVACLGRHWYAASKQRDLAIGLLRQSRADEIRRRDDAQLQEGLDRLAHHRGER